MVETAANIKTTMDAMHGYLDRLRYTAPFGVYTCGILAHNVGFPIWAELTQHVHSKTTQVKTKDLWNGSSNDSPPTGWKDLNFDDSGWATPVVPTIPPPGQSFSDGDAQFLWPTSTPSSSTQEALFRQKFSLGNLPVSSLTLRIAVDDDAREVWLNGHSIWTDTSGNMDTETEVSVDPSYLNPGGDNILAILAKNTWAAGEAWIIWALQLAPMRAALGQYNGRDGKNPHSVVSTQDGAPQFIGSQYFDYDEDSFEFGLDPAGGTTFKTPVGKAKRTYSATQITYRIENIAEDYQIPADTQVDIYIGGTKVITNLASYNKDSWSAELTKTLSTDGCFRSLDYPPHHGFAFGRILYAARGDTTKRDQFRNSELHTVASLEKDLYHPLYAGFADLYDDYFQYDKANWYGNEFPYNGDLTLALPGNQLNGEGGFFYPYESKGQATLWNGFFPVADMWLHIHRIALFPRIVWAIHMLRKYQDPECGFVDPALGKWASEYPEEMGKLSVYHVALEAAAQWDASSGLGMPLATDPSPYYTQVTTASGFITGLFCQFMSIMGYGLGYSQFQSYADAAATQIRKATWGIGPQNNDACGYINDGSGTLELKRPDHKGGVLVVWENASGTLRLPVDTTTKKISHDFLAGEGFFDIQNRIPFGWAFPPDAWTDLHQRLQTPNPVPTSAESTFFCWLGLRTYLMYKYGESYPASTQANGLNIAYGWCWGRVVDYTTANPLQGAIVVVVDGTGPSYPQQITRYRARSVTDSNGYWRLRFGGAGTRTFYAIRTDTNYFARRVVTFLGGNTNERFADAAL